MSRPKKQKEEPIYEVSFKLNEQVETIKANTVLEAFEQFKKPTKFFTKGFIIVKKGDRIKERMLQIIEQKRFFMFPSVRTFLAKVMTL